MKDFTKYNFEPLAIISNAVFGGGAEKSMLALHKEFLNRGIDSHLLALNNGTHTEEVLKIIKFDRQWKEGPKATFFCFLHFRRVLKEINPKTIIVNCELPELFISFVRLSRVRIIGVEHTTYPWFKKRFLGFFVRGFLRIKKIEWVTVSHGKNSIWLSKEIPRYIPNPFVEVKGNIKRASSKLSLSYIGGLKKNKRPEWVIWAGLKNGLDVNLYGAGSLEFYLKKKYAKYKDSIIFHGFKENVWELIPKNSLVIVPSEFEGDGMVVLEAAILGFPLLLSSNADLLRFNFQSKHYFKDLNDLNYKIFQFKRNGSNIFIVENNKRDKLNANRSIKTIATTWLNLMSEIKK